MTDETKTIEVPKDAEAVVATGALSLVANLLHGAPAEIKPYIDAELTNTVQQLMPRIAAIVTGGPALPVGKASSVQLSYEGAIAEARARIPKLAAEVTPALDKIGGDLGALCDSAIASLLVTAENSEYVNHDAFLDIIEGHAKILRGLKGINDVPADYVMDADERSKFEDAYAEGAATH